jgi:hypothetical protein
MEYRGKPVKPQSASKGVGQLDLDHVTEKLDRDGANDVASPISGGNRTQSARTQMSR